MKSASNSTLLLLVLVCLLSSSVRCLQTSKSLTRQTGLTGWHNNNNNNKNKPASSPLNPVRPFMSRLRISTPEVVVEGDNTKDTAEWTKKRLHNNPTFRSAAILGALVAAGISSKSPLSLIPASSAATVHILSFGTWFGTVAYTTFVAGITMFKNLPKKTFGRLQSKLFPKYFALCSSTLVLQLVTLRSLSLAATKSKRALGVALVMTLLNQFYLEPKSTENMSERYRMEDEDPNAAEKEEYKKLKSEFGKFHGLSSLTNLIAFCAGVAHAFYLAAALV